LIYPAIKSISPINLRHSFTYPLYIAADITISHRLPRTYLPLSSLLYSLPLGTRSSLSMYVPRLLVALPATVPRLRFHSCMIYNGIRTQSIIAITHFPSVSTNVTKRYDGTQDNSCASLILVCTIDSQECPSPRILPIAGRLASINRARERRVFVMLRRVRRSDGISYTYLLLQASVRLDNQIR